MNKIASFTVNHLNLLTGVYVSRRDYIGDEVITTFDLRFTRPNEEAPMDTAASQSQAAGRAEYSSSGARRAEALWSLSAESETP